MKREIPAEERVMLPGEVADMFRVHVKTVSRWAIAGKLTPVYTPGGHRRYREAEVLALRNGGTR